MDVGKVSVEVNGVESAHFESVSHSYPNRPSEDYIEGCFDGVLCPLREADLRAILAGLERIAPEHNGIIEADKLEGLKCTFRAILSRLKSEVGVPQGGVELPNDPPGA